jgi:hypothetical protein
MSWEDIIKRKVRLSAAEYRILRQVIADIVEVYDEFERDELNPLIIEAYREHPEINNPRAFRDPKKVRDLLTRIMNGIGTHKKVQRKGKIYWVRK